MVLICGIKKTNKQGISWWLSETGDVGWGNERRWPKGTVSSRK